VLYGAIGEGAHFYGFSGMPAEVYAEHGVRGRPVLMVGGFVRGLRVSVWHGWYWETGNNMCTMRCIEFKYVGVGEG